MDNPLIFLIIVFIVAPLLERLLKAGKGQEPPEPRPGQRIPPSQRRPQRLPQQGPPERQDPATAGRPADETAAAEMLPDDLWEILTGERRSPRQPVPQREEEPAGYTDTYSVEDYPDDDDSLEELAARDVPSADEWMSEPEPEPVVVVPSEPYVRPLPKRDVPRVVSLEQLEIDSETRHDDFHDKLDRMAAAERASRKPPNAFRFTKDDDLRKAIIMSEVLGPPKGLEDPHASPERRGW